MQDFIKVLFLQLSLQDCAYNTMHCVSCVCVRLECTSHVHGHTRSFCQLCNQTVNSSIDLLSTALMWVKAVQEGLIFIFTVAVQLRPMLHNHLKLIDLVDLCHSTVVYCEVGIRAPSMYIPIILVKLFCKGAR